MNDTTKKMLVAGAVGLAAGAVAVYFLRSKSATANSDAIAALEELKLRAVSSLQEELGKVFDAVDTNGNGEVDAQELAAALQSADNGVLINRINSLGRTVGVNPDALIAKLKAATNGVSITRAQFVSAFGIQVKLAQLFATIDSNSDGSLSKAEVVAALKDNADLMYELTAHSQTNLRLFQRLDRDGDGKITFAEFCSLFLSWQ